MLPYPKRDQDLLVIGLVKFSDDPRIEYYLYNQYHQNVNSIREKWGKIDDFAYINNSKRTTINIKI